MYYINPIPTASGAYTALQSSPATGLIAFPNNFFPRVLQRGQRSGGVCNDRARRRKKLPHVYGMKKRIRHI